MPALTTATTTTANFAVGGGIDDNGINYSSNPVTTTALQASVSRLLSRAYQIPCSTAAQAFNQLVQPTSRFQLALDSLLPLLEPGDRPEVEEKILVCFILYSLYAPHPISMNPFKSVLVMTFMTEKAKAEAEGGSIHNEQLVWVLWKILKGDGNDIGPYSPTTLARSPLPPKLKATNLVLDDATCDTNIEESAYLYSMSKDDATSGNQRSDGESVVFTPEKDAENARVARTMGLILKAREKVLSLSEQKDVIAALPSLASSDMIAPLDLVPLIAHNPSLAHPVLVALLRQPFPSLDGTTDDDSSFPYNATSTPFLDILPCLPPTLPTFDLFGNLLRDQTLIANGTRTIGNLIKETVLARFIHESIEYLEGIEKEAEGTGTDVFEVGVANLCRFYLSLLKQSILSTETDVFEMTSIEMIHFSLKNSRIREAGTLYRFLVGG